MSYLVLPNNVGIEGSIKKMPPILLKSPARLDIRVYL